LLETFVLNSDESCTIEVIFEPQDKGVKTSTLAVKYELDGTELYLKNDGDKIINVEDIKLKINDDDFKIDVNGGSNPCGSKTFILSPETSCTIELIFEPQDKGTKITSLIVKYEVDGDTVYNAGLYTGKGSEGGDSGSSIGCNMIATGSFPPFYLLIPVLVGLRRIFRRDH